VKRQQQFRSGFTIVELLIVIVVIGILAAMTIVAFNGIQSRARTTVMQNDIAQAVRKLEATKVTSASGTYPATQAEAALQVSGGNTLNYYYNSAMRSYCVEAINGTTSLFSSGVGQTITTGRCLSNGLIGWWTMNNTANDQSGAGNNGAGVNVTGAIGQNGAANTGYLYDGTSSMMTVPTNTSLHPDSLTITTWIRPTIWSTDAATNFVSKRNGSSGYFFFFLRSTQTVQLDVGGSGNRWNSLYTPPLNQWTHLAVTISPSVGRSLYVNGQPFSSSATATNPVVLNTTDLSIGGESSYGYRFNGTMDDVRMYNRVLADSEVEALFNQGAQ